MYSEKGEYCEVVNITAYSIVIKLLMLMSTLSKCVVLAWLYYAFIATCACYYVDMFFSLNFTRSVNCSVNHVYFINFFMPKLFPFYSRMHEDEPRLLKFHLYRALQLSTSKKKMCFKQLFFFHSSFWWKYYSFFFLLLFRGIKKINRAFLFHKIQCLCTHNITNYIFVE